MKVCSVEQMRRMDQTAVERFGIVETVLMENAGLAAFHVLSEKIGISGKRFAVFCGIGNNGGDGFVVARKIHSRGGHAKVFIIGNPDKFQGAARANLEIIRRIPLEIVQVDSADQVESDLFSCDGIVDAIFGTGLIREVSGLYAEVIDRINSSNRKVLSLDIPSGVSGDNGRVLGIAVKADYTVTFGLPKLGNLLYPGYAYGGQLYTTHISFPRQLFDADDLMVGLNEPLTLPPRNVWGHKGTFGEALFVAGASGYYGAPYFSALSFLKAGGGYSRLAAPADVIPFVASKGSEIVFIPQKQTLSGSIALENVPALLEIAEKMDMVVLGPGLSLNRETQELTRRLAAEISRPILLDGDGITAVCGHLSLISKRKAQTVLTPHMGEMARLTGIPASQIPERPVGILQETAEKLNAIVVLKGAHSLIGTPDQRVFINLSGNSGMATAGSGDVLAGTIAAMFTMGLPLSDAVRQGVFIHGAAGDLAALERGADGMTAQDILELLPLAVRQCREGFDEAFSPKYSGPGVIL